MIEELQYKGYYAEVGISFLEDTIHGKIRGISDLIMFDARTPIGLKEAFENAVDDYLETCNQLGKEPQQEVKTMTYIQPNT